MNLVGRQLSHYKILEEIGSGGMGVVYKAKDLKLDRLVALKFLNKEFLADSEFRQRFVQEAKAISALEHPNIAMVYEIDESDDYMFISMGYYPGDTLQSLLLKSEIPIDKVYAIGVQIARGLAEAHQKGIIHRDIKPGNIILTKDGQVKILDFGLAKVANLTQITRQESVIGTAAYMSPEQLQGLPVDHRSDIFSLGTVLYELGTGRQPFQGEYSAAIGYAIINEEPEAICSIRPEISDKYQQLVTKALAKDLEVRIQNAREIELTLKELLDERATKTAQTSPKPKPKFSRKRMFATLGGLSLGLLLIVLFAILRPESKMHEVGTAIAIMPFYLDNVDEDWSWLSGAFMDLLNTDLSQDSTIRVLSAEQRNQIMQNLGIQNKNVTREEAIRIAQKANAQKVIVGKLNKQNETIQVEAEILDSRKGTSVASLKPLESNISQLYNLVDEFTSQLVGVLNFEAAENVVESSVASLTTSSLDAFRYYVEGKDAALDLRHKESIALLNKAISLDSTFIEPYYYLAWQYSLIGNRNKAKQVLSSGKPYIENLSLEMRLEYLSNEARIEHRWQEYASHQKRLLKINPFKASTHYKYGWTQYRKFRQIDAGISEIQKSIELDSTYVLAYNTLGYAFLAKGEKEKALAMMDKLMQLNPTDVNPLDSMAEILVLIGEYEEAVTICDRILALQPDFKYVPIRLAQALSGQGKYSQAEKVLTKYVNTSAGNYFKSMGYTNLAMVHLRTGNLPVAETTIDDAIITNPNNLEAHWLRGLILLENGNRQEIFHEIAILERSFASLGELEGRWFLHHLQGMVSLFAEDYDEAEVSFKKALDLFPLNRSFYLKALADGYSQAGQLQNAIETYKLALQFNPQNVYALLGLAEAYEKDNAPEEAFHTYRLALDFWAGADGNLQKVAFLNNKISNLPANSKK
ncbi:MAG: protein kinase [bacterium]